MKFSKDWTDLTSQRAEIVAIIASRFTAEGKALLVSSHPYLPRDYTEEKAYLHRRTIKYVVLHPRKSALAAKGKSLRFVISTML